MFWRPRPCDYDDNKDYKDGGCECDDGDDENYYTVAHHVCIEGSDVPSVVSSTVFPGVVPGPVPRDPNLNWNQDGNDDDDDDDGDNGDDDADDGDNAPPLRQV